MAGTATPERQGFAPSQTEYGRLIFRGHFDRRNWLLLLIAPATGVVAASQPDLYPIALPASLFVLIGFAAVIIIASRYDGRTRLAELWQDGEDLVLRGYRAIGIGPAQRIAIAQTSDWTTYELRSSKVREDGIQFHYQGRRYRLPLSHAQKTDRAALERLLDGPLPG